MKSTLITILCAASVASPAYAQLQMNNDAFNRRAARNKATCDAIIKPMLVVKDVANPDGLKVAETVRGKCIVELEVKQHLQTASACQKDTKTKATFAACMNAAGYEVE